MKLAMQTNWTTSCLYQQHYHSHCRIEHWLCVITHTEFTTLWVLQIHLCHKVCNLLCVLWKCVITVTCIYSLNRSKSWCICAELYALHLWWDVTVHIVAKMWCAKPPHRRRPDGDQYCSVSCQGGKNQGDTVYVCPIITRLCIQHKPLLNKGYGNDTTKHLSRLMELSTYGLDVNV